MPVRTRVGHSFIKAQMAERRRRYSAASTPATSTSATSGSPTPGCWRPCTCSPRSARRTGRCRELLAEYSRYVASGEINSEVADQAAATAAGPGRVRGPARRHHRRAGRADRHRPRLVVQPAAVQHRAAAAAQRRGRRRRTLARSATTYCGSSTAMALAGALDLPLGDRVQIDEWLLEILACPKCHAPLRADEAASELVCTGAGLRPGLPGPRRHPGAADRRGPRPGGRVAVDPGGRSEPRRGARWAAPSRRSWRRQAGGHRGAVGQPGHRRRPSSWRSSSPARRPCWRSRRTRWPTRQPDAAAGRPAPGAARGDRGAPVRLRRRALLLRVHRRARAVHRRRGLLRSTRASSRSATRKHVGSPVVAFAVLGIAIVLEGFSLRTAIRESAGPRIGQLAGSFIRRAKAPELPVVLLEDFAALIGLGFALVGVTLSTVTGDGRWDGAGSLAIGALLGCVAVVLAIEMKSLLIGESARPRHGARDRRGHRGRPRGRRVIHLRTLHVGPGHAAGRGEDRGKRAADAPPTSPRHRRGRAQAIRAAVPIAGLIFLEPDLYRRPRGPGRPGRPGRPAARQRGRTHCACRPGRASSRPACGRSARWRQWGGAPTGSRPP